MNFAGTGLAAVVLASIGTLAGCGGESSMNDMNVAIDMRRPDDLSVFVDNDLAKRDMAMGMADMSMRDMAVASMDDMTAMVTDDMPRPFDAPVSILDAPAADAPLVMGDGGVVVVVDASIPDGGPPGDFTILRGDIGIVDAIMDGPGRLPDAPNCTGAPTGACQMCIGMSCANQVIAAFGANWQTKDTGSVCDGIYLCACTCMNGGGNNCLQACVQMKGGQCAVQFNAFATCVMNNCANPCK